MPSKKEDETAKLLRLIQTLELQLRVRKRLGEDYGELLCRITNIVKGPAPEGVSWEFRDLPNEVARWHMIVEALLAEWSPPEVLENLLEAEKAARLSRAVSPPQPVLEDEEEAQEGE